MTLFKKFVAAIRRRIREHQVTRILAHGAELRGW